MKAKSYKVALGGIISAMSLLVMLLASIIPGLEYATPAFAGMLLVIIVIEISMRWAFLTYAAIALLVFFLVPNKESGLLFIAFLGYYPILKSVLETRIKRTAAQWAVKLLIFNISVMIYYKLVMMLVVSPEIADTESKLGEYALYILLCFANIVFIIYDIAMTRIVTVYVKWFRRKVLGRFINKK